MRVRGESEEAVNLSDLTNAAAKSRVSARAHPKAGERRRGLIGEVAVLVAEALRNTSKQPIRRDLGTVRKRR